MPPKHDRPGNRRPLRILTVLFAIGCTLLLGQGLLWGGTARGAARIPVPDGGHVGVPNNASAVSGPWQAASPMPIAVGRYAAAQEGERLYVIGGFVAPGAAEGQTLRYDATTGQWT